MEPKILTQFPPGVFRLPDRAIPGADLQFVQRYRNSPNAEEGGFRTRIPRGHALNTLSSVAALEMEIKRKWRTGGWKLLCGAGLLLLACGNVACGASGSAGRPVWRCDGGSSGRANAVDQDSQLQDLEVHLHKGDIEEMDKRRVVRALVSLSRTSLLITDAPEERLTRRWPTLRNF